MNPLHSSTTYLFEYKFTSLFLISKVAEGNLGDTTEVSEVSLILLVLVYDKMKVKSITTPFFLRHLLTQNIEI